MKTAEIASSDAKEKCVQKTDLITISRDAIMMAAELIEESIRVQYGWQYKSSRPIELAQLVHKTSARPSTEYPGLGDLLNSHGMLTTLANTPSVNDRSPEGLARLKLAAMSAGRGAR